MKTPSIEDMPDICSLCNLPMVECEGHDETTTDEYEEDVEESL